MDENEKKIINNWRNSEKFKIFQEELNEKKHNLLNLKINIMDKKENEGIELNREELFEVIQIKKQKDAMPSTEFDYNYFNIVVSPEDIRLEYTERLLNWFHYLVDAIYSEDFELAIELREVISIEKRQLINLLNKHRTDILINDKEFIKEIENIDVRLYKENL